MNAHAQIRSVAIAPFPPQGVVGAALQARWRGARAAIRADIAVPAAVLGLLVLCALLPGVAPYTTTEMDPAAILRAPGAAHWFGTDHLGRDVLSLVIHGARQSLLVAVGAVAVGLALGGAVGLACGFGGKWLDMAFMRLLEIWQAIPDILLVLVLATALPPSLSNTILTIGIVSSPRFARVMRAQVIALKHRPFVEASRSIGTPGLTILFRHILPHTLSPMLVLATLGVGGAALMGASLSFIGIGIGDDVPDWGYLLSQSRSYLTVAWWFGAFPGLAITALVVSINLLGDALRLKLDPRARSR